MARCRERFRIRSVKPLDAPQALADEWMMTTNKKSRAAVMLGRLGGKAGRGASKARTSDQARAASLARWSKVKAAKPV